MYEKRGSKQRTYETVRGKKEFLQKSKSRRSFLHYAMLCCIELLNCIQNLTVTKPQMEVSWIETRKSRTKSDRNGSNRQRGKNSLQCCGATKSWLFCGSKNHLPFDIKMWRGPALYIEETNEQLLLLLPESICNCVLPLMDKNAWYQTECKKVLFTRCTWWHNKGLP